jgi:prophage tail gpP-like protein
MPLDIDKIELRLGRVTVKDFDDYSIDSDLENAAGCFTLTLSNIDIITLVHQLEEVDRCELYINGVRELTGIVEVIERNVDKQTSTLRIAGRDLMGMLIDSDCELSDCKVFENLDIVETAKYLTRKFTYIGRKSDDIIVQRGCEKRLKPHKQLQIEPGTKVFDALNRYASMRGLVFYCLPDGALVFGGAKAFPNATDPMFHLIRNANGNGNNIKSISIKSDFSKSFSHITVISDNGSLSGPTFFTLKNEDFPAGIYKPLTLIQNGDESSPKGLAFFTLEKIRRESLSIECVVDGHSQNGANWRINNFCSIRDEKFNLKGNYLIYGRTFTKNKDAGTQTTLRLGLGGLKSHLNLL